MTKFKVIRSFCLAPAFASISDSSKALNWADGLRDNNLRNIALENFVESTAYWSPNKAATDVTVISDQGQQEESMRTLMRLSIQTDPASVRNWLNRLDVFSHTKATLQSFLRSNI